MRKLREKINAAKLKQQASKVIGAEETLDNMKSNFNDDDEFDNNWIIDLETRLNGTVQVQIDDQIKVP